MTCIGIGYAAEATIRNPTYSERSEGHVGPLRCIQKMELWLHGDILEQIEYEVVDHDEWGPVLEPYPLVFDHPPRPGSKLHREAVLPYVSALIWAFSQAPDDIPF